MNRGLYRLSRRTGIKALAVIASAVKNIGRIGPRRNVGQRPAFIDVEMGLAQVSDAIDLIEAVPTVDALAP